MVDIFNKDSGFPHFHHHNHDFHVEHQQPDNDQKVEISVSIETHASSSSAETSDTHEAHGGGIPGLVELTDPEGLLTEEEKKKGRKEKESNLTAKYQRSQRDFSTSSMRDQLSSQLNQSAFSAMKSPNAGQPMNQMGTARQMDKTQEPGKETSKEAGQELGKEAGQIPEKGMSPEKGLDKGSDQIRQNSPDQLQAKPGQQASPTGQAPNPMGQSINSSGQTDQKAQVFNPATGKNGEPAPGKSLDPSKPDQTNNAKSNPQMPAGTMRSPFGSSSPTSTASSPSPSPFPTSSPSPQSPMPKMGDGSSNLSGMPKAGAPPEKGIDGQPKMSDALSTGKPLSQSNPFAALKSGGNVGSGAVGQDATGSADASKGLTNTGVNRPVSMFEDKSNTSQTTFAGSDKEQIKMALATKFPVFATLPQTTQNAIVDIFAGQPDLPIDTGSLFIQFAETASFQKLGSSDRQLAFKLLSTLVSSPEFNNTSDGRLNQFLNDVAGGMADLKLYRAPSGEKGNVDATGVSLNLSSPEVADAVNAALKGDTNALASLLVTLSREIPEAQAMDDVWQNLTKQPGFNQLGQSQSDVYQAAKQFPDVNVDRLVKYVAYPIQLPQSPVERSSEIKLFAAIDSSKETVATNNGDSGLKSGSDQTAKPGMRQFPASSIMGGNPSTPMAAADSAAKSSPLPTDSTGKVSTTNGNGKETQLSEKLMSGDVRIGVYRANDGKKSMVDGEKIKMNFADPSVQRSLLSDGKLAAGAVNRMSAQALKGLDQQLAKLESKPGYKKLNEASRRLLAGAQKDFPQADADQLMKFAESQSYQQLGSKGSREKAYAVRMFASMLHECAGDPKRMMLVYNSLQRVFNNDIKFNGFMQETGYMSSNDGGVTLNPKYMIEGDMESMATLVVEVNHVIHEKPNMKWGGTISVFANEYRAAYMEALFLTNQPPVPQLMDQFLNGLLNTQPSSVYAHIRNTYDTDPEFARVIDWIKHRITEDHVVTPEELRQSLIGMIGKTPNIASKEPFEQSWSIDNESPFPDATAVVARVSQQIPLDMLNPAEQAVLINLVRKYNADPQTFQQYMQTSNFKQLNENDRTWSLRVIGGLSSEAVKSGTGSPANRTLTQINTNRASLAFYQDENDGRLQFKEGSTIQINLSQANRLMIDDWIGGLNDSVIASVLNLKK